MFLIEAAARWWRWRRRNAQVADETKQIGALQAQRACRVRPVAPHLTERRLDQPALECADRAVIAGGAVTAGIESEQHGRLR